MARQLFVKSATERKADADGAASALALLRDAGHPPGTDEHSRVAYPWAVQNATAIAQSFTRLRLPRRGVLREDALPRPGHGRQHHLVAAPPRRRILLASGNGHLACTSDNPAEFPEPTGAFLHRRLGGGYVNIGVTFSEGTVNALPDYTAQQPETYTVTSAPDGHHENTLDKVRYRDFSIDLRTAPAAARIWLDTARPTRSYGLYWSADAPDTALTRSYDILIHLHQVEVGRLR